MSDSSREEQDPIILYTEVTTRCQNRCRFCDNDKVGRKGFVMDEVKERVVELIASRPGRQVRVYTHLVGEPLLYPGLADYIRKLSLPNVELWVCTNGILLDIRKIHELHAAGLRFLWFTFFGTSPADYRRFTGTEHFDRAWCNLVTTVESSHLFEHVQIVTFSSEADEIRRLVKTKPNVSLEIGRNVENWNGDVPSQRGYICVSIDGDITFDWMDHSFSESPGNILALDNESVICGYGDHCRRKKRRSHDTAGGDNCSVSPRPVWMKTDS